MRRLVIAIACATFFAAPFSARATVVKAMTLEEKTQASPLVVHAIVERVETEWDVPDVRTRTLITMTVLETLKGDAAPGERIIVHQTGGRIGDFQLTAPGLSRYEEGEECVMFLEPLGPYLIEIGIGIGKYGIENEGGEQVVKFAPNVAAFKKHPGGRAVVETIEPMKPEALSVFLKRVRSYARGIPVDLHPPRKGVELKMIEKKAASR